MPGPPTPPAVGDGAPALVAVETPPALAAVPVIAAAPRAAPAPTAAILPVEPRAEVGATCAGAALADDPPGPCGVEDGAVPAPEVADGGALVGAELADNFPLPRPLADCGVLAGAELAGSLPLPRPFASSLPLPRPEAPWVVCIFPVVLGVFGGVPGKTIISGAARFSCGDFAGDSEPARVGPDAGPFGVALP